MAEYWDIVDDEQAPSWSLKQKFLPRRGYPFFEVKIMNGRVAFNRSHFSSDIPVAAFLELCELTQEYLSSQVKAQS